jgi:hypothetical protein
VRRYQRGQCGAAYGKIGRAVGLLGAESELLLDWISYVAVRNDELAMHGLVL